MEIKRMKMNRKLVIITNDGGHNDFLQGVATDKNNYISFFKSDEGGAWEDYEMYIPETNGLTLEALKNYIINSEKKLHVDYWLIVFCGHGGATKEGNTYFQLNENDLLLETELKEMVRSSVCLLIADSCRSIPKYEYGGTLKEKLCSVSDAQPDETYRKRCRMIYNDQIKKIPAGAFFRAYATSFKQYANDLGYKFGGHYTYNLLKVAQNYIKEKRNRRITHLSEIKDCIYSISWIHKLTSKIVEKETNGKQVPQYLSPRTGASDKLCQV